MKKLKKAQHGGIMQPESEDVRNNEIMKYFNDLEASRNRRGPGMSGDVVPTNKPVVDPGEGTVTTRDLESGSGGRKIPDAIFQKGGGVTRWEGIGKNPFKKLKKISKRKLKKSNKSPKVNRRGLYKT